MLLRVCVFSLMLPSSSHMVVAIEHMKTKVDWHHRNETASENPNSAQRAMNECVSVERGDHVFSYLTEIRC
jgi:hypothetical protein